MDNMTNKLTLIVAAVIFSYSFGACADCSGPLRFYAVAEYKTGSTVEVRHIIASTYDYSSADALTRSNSGYINKTADFSESETKALKGFINKFIKDQIGNKKNVVKRFSFVDGYTLNLQATPEYSEVSFRLIDTKHTHQMTVEDVNAIHRFLHFNYNEFSYPAVVSANILNFIKSEKPYRVRDLRYDYGSKYALDYMQSGERETVELTYQAGCL